MLIQNFPFDSDMWMSSKFYLEPTESSVFSFSLVYNVAGLFRYFTSFINNAANKYIFNIHFKNFLLHLHLFLQKNQFYNMRGVQEGVSYIVKLQHYTSSYQVFVLHYLLLRRLLQRQQQYGTLSVSTPRELFWGSGHIAPYIHNVGTRWKRMVRFTSLPA